jgi:4-diphosphocytidyl-2-C-methyl-D-erythritol kinase
LPIVDFRLPMGGGHTFQSLNRQSTIVNQQSFGLVTGSFLVKDSLALPAFAKINLGLRILGKRPDGYHEIRTLYQTVELHDRLEVVLLPGRDDIVMECNDAGVPSGRGNLVFRASELWRRARRFKGRIQIRLEKRIPVGSGLGGASSDAAVTLLGLEHLSGDQLDLATRLRLAARLGSDVPGFLWGGRVLGCGRGEEVYPLDDLPRRHCLVVFPGFSVSTAEAYRQAGWGLTRRREARKLTGFGVWSRVPLESWGPAENDYEQVVFARWPELAKLKRQLIQAGAETALLTGSGSAVYAIFDSALKLAQASKSVPAAWHTLRTRTLSRAEYRRRVLG